MMINFKDKYMSSIPENMASLNPFFHVNNSMSVPNYYNGLIFEYSA